MNENDTILVEYLKGFSKLNIIQQKDFVKNVSDKLTLAEAATKKAQQDFISLKFNKLRKSEPGYRNKLSELDKIFKDKEDFSIALKHKLKHLNNQLRENRLMIRTEQKKKSSPFLTDSLPASFFGSGSSSKTDMATGGGGDSNPTKENVTIRDGSDFSDTDTFLKAARETLNLGPGTVPKTPNRTDKPYLVTPDQMTPKQTTTTATPSDGQGTGIDNGQPSHRERPLAPPHVDGESIDDRRREHLADNFRTTDARVIQKENSKLLKAIADASSNSTKQLAEHLTDMLAHTQKTSIPLFTGVKSESIKQWYKDAQRVAVAAGWSDDQTKKYFCQRLHGIALAFNDTLQPDLSLQEWKKEMYDRFRDEAEQVKYKMELEYLRQSDSMRVKDFYERINHLYKKAYGKLLDGRRTYVPQQTIDIQNNIRKSIFLRGLNKKINNEVWGKIKSTDDFDSVVQTAVDCEISYESRKALEEGDPITSANNKTMMLESKVDSVLSKLESLSLKQEEKAVAEDNKVAVVRSRSSSGDRPHSKKSRNDKGNRDRNNHRSDNRRSYNNNNNNNNNYNRRGRGRGGYRGNGRSFYNQNRQYNNSNRGPIICHRCQKPGHIAKNCVVFIPNQWNNNRGGNRGGRGFNRGGHNHHHMGQSSNNHVGQSYHMPNPNQGSVAQVAIQSTI